MPLGQPNGMGGARLSNQLVEARMSEEKQAEKQPEKKPTLFRNYISFAGAVIVTAAVVSILLLFLIELTQTTDNPYLGIVTYIILPAFLVFGLVVVLTGMLLE